MRRVKGDEGREGTGQSMRGLVGHGEDLGLFSKSGGRAKEGSEQRSMVPGFRSSHTPSGGCAGNRLPGESNAGATLRDQYMGWAMMGARLGWGSEGGEKWEDF